MQTLETQRLKLVPFTLELKRATMTERAKFEEMLGVYVPGSWPGPDLAEALPFFVEHMEKDPAGNVWDGLIIHKANRALIGDMGFMGGPDEQGALEIGYSIVPEYRNQGYATEMASALIDWAFEQQGIKVVVARCLSDNVGSIKVLEKVGMRRVGQEGDMLDWEIRR